MSARPPLGFVSVIALVAVTTTVTSVVGTPGPRRAKADRVEVVGATAVCPDMRQVAGSVQTRISVGAAPLPLGRASGQGQVSQQRVVGDLTSTPVPVQSPGEVGAGLAENVNNNGLVVSATGSLAAGLEVEQVTRGFANNRDRGLAGLRCEPPKPEAWFVGGGSGANDYSVLVLANVEDTPTTVDVTVFSENGPLDPRPGLGITVAPHSRRLVPMDTLAPDHGGLVVHVLSRRGRFAAGLRTARTQFSTPLGVDWVPQTGTPATTVVVPGFPAGPGGRALILANPGVDDTTASIQVMTSDGQFVPTGMDAVAVRAQHSVIVYLTGLAASGPLAARVTSSGSPLLAAGLVGDSQRGPVQEISFTTGSEPLSGPALLTDLAIDRPTESTLLFTAPDGAARVDVTPIRVLGTVGALPGPRTIDIPAGRTVAFRLSTFYPPGTATRLAVEVRPDPGSGPVYAARYLREHGAHGPLTTLLDLQGPDELVDRPQVTQDTQAGY